MNTSILQNRWTQQRNTRQRTHVLGMGILHNVRQEWSRNTPAQFGKRERASDLHDATQVAHLHVVRVFVGADGARLDEDFVDAAKAAQITTGDITDSAQGFCSFHHDCSGDALYCQASIAFSGCGVRVILGAHDAHFHAGAYGAGENPSEGVESALV